MFRKILAPLFILSGLVATVTPAHSATICGNRTQMVNALSQEYSEQPAFEALTSDGKLMEVLTSEKGTWTVLLTSPVGRTCVVAAGTSWDTLRQMKLGPSA